MNLIPLLMAFCVLHSHVLVIEYGHNFIIGAPGPDDASSQNPVVEGLAQFGVYLPFVFAAVMVLSWLTVKNIIIEEWLHMIRREVPYFLGLYMGYVKYKIRVQVYRMQVYILNAIA